MLAHHSRALVAFAKDWSSVISIHTESQNHLNSSTQRSNNLFWPPEAPEHGAYTEIQEILIDINCRIKLNTTVYISHISRQILCLRVVGQHNRNNVILDVVISVEFWFGVFCSFGLLLAYCDFVSDSLVNEKEHKVRWVWRSEKSGGIGKGKIMSKYIA